MLFNYIILLLLYWPYTKGIKNDYIVDQVATASDEITELTKDTVGKIAANSLSSSTEPNNNDIHYENSNGFVPMIKSTLHQVSNLTSTKGLPNSSANDLYLSDARIFLNLSGSTINRRSFESHDGQKEFEILKVKDQTPAIANYDEFYENLKNNMHNNAQPSIELTRNVPYHRTGERMKQIENYLNYGINQHSNSNPYSLYYHQENSRDTQKKTIHEQEKVHNNYHQHGAPDYDIFGESVTLQRTTSLPSINYDNSNAMKNNRNKLTLLSKQRQSKPLVVIDPKNYKINSNYPNQQSPSKSSSSTTHSYYSTPEDRYDRNEDYSDENDDYYEVTERPRRLHKSRRKPNYSDSSRKLPKEHRGSSLNDSDELKKVNSLTRGKSHRTKSKSNYHYNENQSKGENESSEEVNDKFQIRDMNKNNGKSENDAGSWSQLAPNIEISQSNGYELSQIDKPNLLVPINLNLVPVTNFDHSTALGGSQGFDFTNAGIPNFITSGSIVSTAAPLVSSSQPILMSSVSPQSSTKNGENIGNGNYAYSTAVPDIIVGQNSIQNTVQAVLLPQSMQNKYSPNLKTYYQSTASPMLAVSPATYSTPSLKSNTPQVTAVPQLFYPSSILQPITPTPGRTSTNYDIIVNPNGLHGQNSQPASHHNDNDINSNISNNGNIPSPNIVDKQSAQGAFTGSNSQFLASASFSVGRGAQLPVGQTNENKYYVPTNNVDNNVFTAAQNNPQVLSSQLQTNIYPKIKTFIPAQVIPAFVQTAPGITGVNIVNPNQQQHQHQLVNVGNNYLGNTWGQLQQFQQNSNQPNVYNNRVQYQNLYTNKDNVGSTSNNNANTMNMMQNGVITRGQLPIVGVQTVEIQTPNIYIKPSQVDVSGQYPTAVLTTPIPIFNTAQSFLTPRPAVTSTTPESINIQSYVDSLTQIGSQNNRLEQKVNNQNHFDDRPIYNPLNFVPSTEVVQSQTLLNGKTPEQSLPPQLNLVPVIPGGKFYKHSHSAQADLITKPKLSSDLEKYAEEMFKESIRTIYNSHKWNTDKRPKNYTSDGIDINRLKNDLERYKAAMIASTYGKDILEGHHSEPQVHTTDPGRVKKPALSAATLDELFKNDFKLNSLSDFQVTSNARPESSNVKNLNDYLTPPKIRSHGNNKSVKKRPNKTRSHLRPTRYKNLDTSASNHVTYSHRRPLYNRNVRNEYRKSKNHDNYPTFTTPTSNDSINQVSKNEYYDINHPRTHNYLGLLMKTKQLPTGSATSILRDENDYKQYLDNDRRRLQRITDGSSHSSPSSYVRKFHQ